MRSPRPIVKQSRDVSEYSKTGDRNLEITREQSRFTQWMYDEIKPYVKGHVLEVGSGIGTYSDYIRKQDKAAVFSEIDAAYVSQLKKRFPKHPVFLLDIANAASVAAIKKQHKFDTIIFLNVLEHIEDHEKALKLLRTILTKEGRIICLVPTHKFLYNAIDANIGHYRRYTKKELRAVVEKTGYTCERLVSFNFFAIFGWYLNGNIMKKSQVDQGAMRLFNTLVPIFKLFERYVLFKSVGISTIIIAKR